MISDEKQLVEVLVVTARAAGAEILRLVQAGFEIETKGDQSPVTVCDWAAEQVILRALAAAAPDVPVIAEEEVSAGRIPAHDDTYFLVDPLDGTKEFVRGGDDYTVNIGLIAGGQPKLGVVYQPAIDKLWAGLVGDGAFVEVGGSRRPIHCRPLGVERAAIASKSHYNQATDDYLAEAIGVCDHVSVGSSLKFCVVAEGKADIYPRLSPTSEWDTAAGHAVLLAAGGRVDGLDGLPLAYGKPAFLNRGFCATAGWPAPPIGPFMDEFSGGGELPQGV
ncbi:3'(2'),5'-bisphosphate nucleotidase CysQ [Sphingomonas sp. G124]|uniref:3'(2'),5'-bisphosphate nucleotidase CysQ n=1 Tax=Sphingomonas cremea TaxID=2904799 RepID=A0A9X1TXA5_9SPHN|nr:3'(2'),5'-bisphosphate nucleotidase CysQ [Sphingomonas cremea]MCF2513652.1 3'(2'),5'-bisphosphate nucleotidase CysQ [Sphingomonas cremea]